MGHINYIEKHSKTFSVKPHKHLYPEIIYVTEGEGDVITKDLTLHYKKNEIICIPPNIEHTNISSGGMKNIHLTMEDISLPVHNAIVIPATTCSTLFQKQLEIAYIAFHMYPKNLELNISVSGVILNMLTILLNFKQFSRNTLIIEMAIMENFTNPNYDINDSYSQCSICKERARKIFKKEKGITPIQFLKQKRIELAKHLLTQKHFNALNINEIAYNCGFEDPAFFSRIFKKETGVAPSQYQFSTLANNKVN